MKVNFLILLLCLPLLCACQSTEDFLVKHPPKKIDFYLDDRFQSEQVIEIETEQDIFYVDEAMRVAVNSTIRYGTSNQQKAYALLKHLFDEEHIALNYDGNANLTASQTYHAKVANCMSLTIMAYALADAADMSISFREVDVPEYWVRNGQYNLLTGHVNLLVTESGNKNTRLIWGESATIIDFDPFVAKKRFPSREINKKTLVAMFYNNKGADALAANNYLLAYQYLKMSTLTDNQFSPAWGNLGVLYKLSGYYEHAEYAYLEALRLKDDNLNALANLAMLLNKQERHVEASPIEDYIHKLRSSNPYYHALLADEAMFAMSYEKALKHYKKAIALDDEQHEFYFGLAKVYYQLDKLTLSKRAMKQAVSRSKVKFTQNRYIAKLNFLKEQQSSITSL